ncbi:hypothetical protein SAMN05421578_13913 [Paenibacillus macquariensis]|uniref:Uncharacterized protein n=1 Tax=Paenibacillus macquariensis TaxID=948756 RepID=A0ABY1KEI8_9BACL|nr:hypothetical protein SAMN05421578_13913 [Paenibacillus macquariensis]
MSGVPKIAVFSWGSGLFGLHIFFGAVINLYIYIYQ